MWKSVCHYQKDVKLGHFWGKMYIHENKLEFIYNELRDLSIKDTLDEKYNVNKKWQESTPVVGNSLNIEALHLQVEDFNGCQFHFGNTWCAYFPQCMMNTKLNIEGLMLGDIQLGLLGLYIVHTLVSA